MRKLVESTVVSLDSVIGAPERRASFDAEATALSLEQTGLHLKLTGLQKLENGSLILTHAPG